MYALLWPLSPTPAVPIIPDYLYQLEHDHILRNQPPTNTTTTPTLLTPTPWTPQEPAVPTFSLPQTLLVTPQASPTGPNTLYRQPRFLRVPKKLSPQSHRQQQLLRLLKKPDDRPSLDVADLKGTFLTDIESVSDSPRYEQFREDRKTERGMRRNEEIEGIYNEDDENNQRTKNNGHHLLQKSLFAEEEIGQHKDEVELQQSKDILQPVRPLPLATMTNSPPHEPPSSAAPAHQQEPPPPRAEAGVRPSTSSADEGIITENGRVGLLFSSKALVQLLVNPLVGPLTAHVGYSLPLVVGTHNLILSALREYRTIVQMS